MSLTPHSIKRFSGLYGSTNPFSRIPEGALAIADNCVIRSSDVLEPRRGFKASASCGAPVNALTFKQGVAVGITYDSPGAGITGTLRKYDPAANTWTTLPMNPGGFTIDRPGGQSGVDTRFVSAQKAIYFQSKYGLTKIEDISTGVCRCALSDPVPAGAGSTAGLYGMEGGQILTTAGNNWLANGNSVAYRFTTCRFGANGELIESAPSDRVIFTNTTGSPGRPRVDGQNGPLSSPDSFIRIYRSAQATVTPSDEMFLIAERIIVPAGGTMSNGFQDSGIFGPPYDDQTSDSALFVPLYTNANTGGTLAVANEQAPLSADLAWFRGRLYGLNTSLRQNVTVRIIGTGTGGINAGDYFFLGGHKIVFTTKNMDIVSNGVYIITIFTAGTTTANVELTSRNMVQAIGFNFDPSPGLIVSPAIGAPLTAELIANAPTVGGTGGNDSGYVIIRSVVPGTPPFVFQTGSSPGWDRDYTGGLTSTSNSQVAGLSWSNINEPEGFPLANNTLIGDPTADGQRCIALKEALFVFKEDGLWKVTDDGSELGPSVQPVDPTIRLVAPETAVALDNFILALCDQGVVLISETGAVANISHTQIEREILALMSRVGSSTIANLAFGVAYQSEHTYILSLPESSNATACTRQYVYNLQTQTWTSWTVPGVLCGAVNPDTGQLYLGRTDGTIWIERKNYDSSDYQDPGFTIASPTTSAVASMVFSGDLRTGSTPFAVGDVVQQFQALHAIQQRVIAVSYSSTVNQTTVTLDAVPRYAWTNAVPLTVVKAIQCAPTFLPFYDDEPLQDKEWGDAFLSFRYCDLDFLLAGFTSEKYPLPSGTNPAIERINNSDGSLAPVTLQTWAPLPWGKALWGRQTRDVILKATIMQDVQGYSSQLTVSLSLPCALSRFELSALDVKILGSTSQVTR